MAFIKLTIQASKPFDILVNASHIVSVHNNNNAGTRIELTGDINYTVIQSFEDLSKALI